MKRLAILNSYFLLCVVSLVMLYGCTTGEQTIDKSKTKQDYICWKPTEAYDGPTSFARVDTHAENTKVKRGVDGKDQIVFTDKMTGRTKTLKDDGSWKCRPETRKETACLDDLKEIKGIWECLNKYKEPTGPDAFMTHN